MNCFIVVFLSTNVCVPLYPRNINVPGNLKTLFLKKCTQVISFCTKKFKCSFSANLRVQKHLENSKTKNWKLKISRWLLNFMKLWIFWIISWISWKSQNRFIKFSRILVESSSIPENIIGSRGLLKLGKSWQNFVCAFYQTLFVLLTGFV